MYATRLVLIIALLLNASTIHSFADDRELTASPLAHETLKLEQVLAQYERIAAKGGWPQHSLNKALKPGEHDPALASIREILRRMGDYVERPAEDEYYDETLAQAVTRFQLRHGLEGDAVLGAKTRAALNVPVERRIAEMKATLEHMRADIEEATHKYVMVNVPGYTLTAIEHGQVAFTSRVIVGDPKNATPLFANAITHISFNPKWNVPQRIAVEELLEKERKKPGYLEQAGFSLVSQTDGSAVDVDEAGGWESVESGEYRIRQREGEGNALGKVKFSLPNNNAIYLHSTANPRLFSKAERALSHGCIRVENTRELAQFVLSGMQGWDAEKINRTYDSDAQRVVRVEPVPVRLVYWTSFVDGNGLVHFHPDIYRKDEKRVAELMKGEQQLATRETTRF